MRNGFESVFYSSSESYCILRSLTIDLRSKLSLYASGLTASDRSYSNLRKSFELQSRSKASTTLCLSYVLKVRLSFSTIPRCLYTFVTESILMTQSSRRSSIPTVLS